MAHTYCGIRYSIFDPTGNITALVESPVEVCDQPAAAARIMELRREVEQVGFVKFSDGGQDDVRAELRMAGGEFCGNAAMSAAALYAIRSSSDAGTGRDSVRLRVSGTDGPVTVCLERESEVSFRTQIRMPSAMEIGETEFEWGETSESLPVVRMEGISHIIIEPDKSFFRLLSSRDQAENLIRVWCRNLSAGCLGLMFLQPVRTGEYALTPLVYASGCGTVFWENSCASGSSAAGMYLSSQKKSPVSLTLREPGGILSVDSSFPDGETFLRGRACLAGSFELPG